MINTKTLFISERERDHILSAFRAGFKFSQGSYSEPRLSSEPSVFLGKLELLNKNMNNTEKSDIARYECLRKKMKEVRCNAKQLLQSEDISVEEMRTIIKNLNRISKKMKVMSKKLGSRRFAQEELSESDASDHSTISIKNEKRKVVSQEGLKRKNKDFSPVVDKREKKGPEKNNSKVFNNRIKTQKPPNTQLEETKSLRRNRSKISDIFKDRDCSSHFEELPKESDNKQGKNIIKYSKSNDHQQHCHEGLLVESCSKCLCRRWSIPNVNRNSLKTYIQNNIKNNGHKTTVNNDNAKDCCHTVCQSKPLSKEEDYVALPGLVPQERNHMKAVREKILKDKSCCSGLGLKNSSTGCCFGNPSDLEVFETSDSSLNKEEECGVNYDSSSASYKEGTDHIKKVDGPRQCEGKKSVASYTASETTVESGDSRQETGSQEVPHTGILLRSGPEFKGGTDNINKLDGQRHTHGVKREISTREIEVIIGSINSKHEKGSKEMPQKSGRSGLAHKGGTDQFNKLDGLRQYHVEKREVGCGEIEKIVDTRNKRQERGSKEMPHTSVRSGSEYKGGTDKFNKPDKPRLFDVEKRDVSCGEIETIVDSRHNRQGRGPKDMPCTSVHSRSENKAGTDRFNKLDRPRQYDVEKRDVSCGEIETIVDSRNNRQEKRTEEMPHTSVRSGLECKGSTDQFNKLDRPRQYDVEKRDVSCGKIETIVDSRNREEKKNEVPQISTRCCSEYKGGTDQRKKTDCMTQCNEEESDISCKTSEVTVVEVEECEEVTRTSPCFCPKGEEINTKRKTSERVDKAVQSASQKVDHSTSYDNFVLHPQFSWSMPMIGQAFRRSIPLAQERWRYFDKRGHFRRPSKPSTETGTTTKKPKRILVRDRSVQTNDMLFTNNMNQVMYLNVVYTKTHLRYIIPNTMELPVLPQTPKVIERRAIDNGYAVTTYKADPDGVIHFTLAYSDRNEAGAEGKGLPIEDNQRLCQLKDLWICSARKFFSLLNEKLVREAGDYEESELWHDPHTSTTDFTTTSVTPSESSNISTTANDTEGS